MASVPVTACGRFYSNETVSMRINIQFHVTGLFGAHSEKEYASLQLFGNEYANDFRI